MNRIRLTILVGLIVLSGCTKPPTVPPPEKATTPTPISTSVPQTDQSVPIDTTPTSSRLYEGDPDEIECSQVDCEFRFEEGAEIAICPARNDTQRPSDKVPIFNDGCVDVRAPDAVKQTQFVLPLQCRNDEKVKKLCKNSHHPCCLPVFPKNHFPSFRKFSDNKCFHSDFWGYRFNESLVNVFQEPSFQSAGQLPVETYRIAGTSFQWKFVIRLEKNTNGIFVIRKLMPLKYRDDSRSDASITIVSNDQWTKFKSLVKQADFRNLHQIRQADVKDGETWVIEAFSADGYFSFIRSNTLEPEMENIIQYLYYLAGILPGTKTCIETERPADTNQR